jgi:hypothetical protein
MAVILYMADLAGDLLFYSKDTHPFIKKSLPFPPSAPTNLIWRISCCIKKSNSVAIVAKQDFKIDYRNEMTREPRVTCIAHTILYN